MECETKGCKANLPHRLGIHSHWCKHFSLTDDIAKRKMLRQVRYPNRTKAEILGEEIL